MQVSEQVEQYVAALSAPLPAEVLHFVEYLLARAEDETSRQEAGAWRSIA